MEDSDFEDFEDGDDGIGGGFAELDHDKLATDGIAYLDFLSEESQKQSHTLPRGLPRRRRPAMDFTGYKALSFDCYGTLIDWEGGLAADLAPILTRLPAQHAWNKQPLAAVVAFNAHSEHLWAAQPTLPYEANLAESFRLLVAEAGVTLPDAEAEEAAKRIAAGPGRWPAFPDTVAGLLKLKRRFKLIILSNVNNANIARTVDDNLVPVEFDAVYTAEDIGSYKPAHANFRYLFEHAKADLGVDKDAGQLLHVARSLTADHVPAKELGLPSVWISRGGDNPRTYGTGGDYLELMMDDKLGFKKKFKTIGEFADEVERQFTVQPQL